MQRTSPVWCVFCLFVCLFFQRKRAGGGARRDASRVTFYLEQKQRFSAEPGGEQMLRTCFRRRTSTKSYSGTDWIWKKSQTCSFWRRKNAGGDVWLLFHPFSFTPHLKEAEVWLFSACGPNVKLYDRLTGTIFLHLHVRMISNVLFVKF